MAENKNYIRTEDESGSINISEEVVAAIVAAAVTEAKGVHGLYFSPGKEVSQTISKKGIAKSVKLNLEDDNITIDVYFYLAKGFSANEVGLEVQKGVKTAVHDAVGVEVKAVNVHICGVILKDKPGSTTSAKKKDKPVTEEESK
jgi:uncharacterized alkaline shock family protein YloU